MKLVLIGGGGHCRACMDVIADAGLQLAGIIDPAPLPKTMPPIRLGGDDWLDTPDAQAHLFLVTVGQTSISPVRRNLFDGLTARGLKAATIRAGSATISSQASIGTGTMVMHHATVNYGATIGANCIINTGAIVEHDVRIADHCHVSTGAVVNGGAQIGEGSMIASGAIILPGIKIAAGVLVGAGAVVTKDIDTPGTWLGTPARRKS